MPCSTAYNYFFITWRSIGRSSDGSRVVVCTRNLHLCIQKTVAVIYILWPRYLLLSSGPLLPEHLDVRNIPVSRARELTIDLSGMFYSLCIADACNIICFKSRVLECFCWQILIINVSNFVQQKEILIIEKLKVKAWDKAYIFKWLIISLVVLVIKHVAFHSHFLTC